MGDKRVLVAVLFLVSPLGLAAQEPAPAPATPAPPRVVTGQDGFAVESANGDFRLQFGLLLHVDGRFALADEAEQYVDNFAVRRLRPYLRGRFARRFEFYVNPDVAGGNLTVQDAYVDTIFAPAFRIRAGKAKTPFGFERLHPAANMVFMERGFPTALAPNRDIGVQALGDLFGGVVSYLAGVMNGVADGASGDVDNNDGKDIAGRLVLRPFNRQDPRSAARGFGIGVSGSRGEATGAAALASFRTQTLQQPYFSYLTTGPNPAVADGIRTRFSPSGWYFYKGFAGWAEYVRTLTPVRRGDLRTEIAHQAWQLTGSWVLTGESATDSGSGVRPRRNFDFGKGGWGAFQLAVRYHQLEVGDEAFDQGVATPGASRTAEAFTAGVRWYVTGNLWYTLNFERTVFDGHSAGARRRENGLAFRTQVGF
jgi:phosphate-selective porin OprO and OprP